jgi:hypothetical protein
MVNTIGQFDYEITKMDSDSPLPFNPQIVLCLKHWGATTRDSAPTISATLMTEQEIDFHVDQLKADLDRLAGTAKAALSKEKTRTKELESQREST